MSGDVRTGRSDLGDSETRVRRMLNLEGLVPVDWNGQIVPVMIVGDGMLPGFGTSRQRRWQLTHFLTAAAGVDRWVTVDQDMIIDRIIAIPTAVATLAIDYQGPNDASPGVINGRSAPFIDRAQTSQELAPVRDATLGVAGGSRLFSTNTITPAGQTIHEVVTTPFLLCGPNVPGQDGARLRFTSSANVVWTIEGRTF